jgi:hypothetical protein
MPNVFTAPGSPSSAHSSKMEDTPDPQVEKLLGGLSPEQVQSLLLLLQGGHQPSIQKSEPIRGGSKASPWPKWDGEDLSFPLYLARLRVKVKADQQLLGGPEVTCHGILETLPETKRTRVSQWFLSGGPHKDWNVDEFLLHLKDKFENKEAVQTAGDELQRMRMGDSQKFDSLLDDFEFKLALCGGAEWPDRDRILRLNAMINAKLSDALVTVDLPDDDYQSWVTRTRKIAARLEARPGYVTSRNVTTWFIKKGGSSAFFSRPQTARPSPEQPNTPMTDSDGDIQMTGVNSAMVNLLTTLVNQLGSKGQSPPNRGRNKSSRSSGRAGKTKARARWVPTSEASELIENGRCFSCREKGHIARECPEYRPASRPAGVNHTTASEPVSDSEESKSGSGYETGKE